MRFRFNERKAAQAAAHLLRLHSNRLNYTVLLKLLYLADRTALVETGVPITGDKMVSMPHGTVLSSVLDCINAGGRVEGSPWSDSIAAPSGYEVQLSADPGRDELSAFELEVLERTDQMYGAMDWRQLRHLTHGLPEYRDPSGSSMSIEPEEILRAEGKSAADIERISQDAEELWFIDRLREQTS